ncbi:glycoside hydrolase family protein, partial [Sarcina ventriculi]|uniref:glycoside hydrolase family protein n=1 Tax=Sarcina ventriculi TaxID=1267 RepID=UPI0038B53BDF
TSLILPNRNPSQNNFRKQLNEVALQITPLTQGLNLNQNEFDSLVDFAYNLGVDALKNSDLLANIKLAIITRL